MKFFLAFVFSMAALPAISQQYLCAMKSQGEDSGYIAPEIFVDLAADGSAATVNDGIIAHFTGEDKGTAAKVIENNDKRVVLRWSVDLRDTGGQSTRMGYRMTIFKNDMTLRINGKPMGYANNFEGRGTCQER